jgi:hypothetical protein
MKDARSRGFVWVRDIRLAFFLILQRSADQVEQKRTHKYCSSIFRSQQGGKMHLSAVHFSCLTLERIYKSPRDAGGAARAIQSCLLICELAHEIFPGRLSRIKYLRVLGRRMLSSQVLFNYPVHFAYNTSESGVSASARNKNFFSLAWGVFDPLALSAKLFAQRGLSSGLKSRCNIK